MPQEDNGFVLDAPATALAAPVVRAMAAGVAMAHDVAFDEITDIRLAVDEACSLLLPHAAPDTRVSCTVQVDPALVEVTVQITSHARRLPDSTDLHILRALATDLHTSAAPAGPGITRLTMRMQLARAAT